MSLLMDALKKAEQEKKAAAERLREAQNKSPQDEVVPAQELSMEERSSDLDQDVKKPEAQIENRDQPDDPDEVGNLTLSPIENGGLFVEDIEDDDSSIQDQSDTNLSATGDGPVEEIEKTAIIDRRELEIGDITIVGRISDEDQMVEPVDLQADDSVENATDLTASPSYDLEDTIKADAVDGNDQKLSDATGEHEKISATVSAEQLSVEPLIGAEQTVSEATGEHEDFSATVSAEQLSDISNQYLSTTVSVAQLAKDIGSDAPTPVAARTVFTATSTGDSNQMYQWGIFAALCLVIAVSLSFFIFNYTVPAEREIKSPLVARGIETQNEPTFAIEIPEDLRSGEELDSKMFTGEIGDIIEKENAAIVEGLEKPALDEVPEAGTEGVAINEPEPESMTEESVTTIDQAQEEIWYPPDEVSAEEYATKGNVVKEVALSLPEKITPEPELIKISRSKSVDKDSVLVSRAYEEYLAGDFDSAEKNYLLVLNNLPGNRDALLGLAALSLRKGDIRQAYIHYLEVLRLYPGDSVAEAALINFTDNEGSSRSESILKTFLQSEPDNSFLHYSLARIFAAQTRWPEAQVSFFDAHRIESSNADYAFNLAVSLEHIGQRQSAINYYNVALDLVDNPAASFATSGFDRAVAISRINALTGRALSNQGDIR
jgi:tetratricopeptide (TPR) repeat protein